MLHPLLLRQLQRNGLVPDAPPTLEGWRGILERISRSYEGADHDRYTNERSLAISSREMKGLHQNLSASASAESALRVRLEAVVSSIGDGLCFVDAEGWPVFVNPAAVELLGLTAEDVDSSGACTKARLNAALGGPDSAVAAALSQGEVSRVDRAVLLRGEDFAFPAACLVTPVRSGDVRLGAVLLFRDTMESERIAADLVHSRDRAESAARAKSDFLATMSHELRTPLNGVIGMADLLLGTDLSSEQRECTQVIQSSAYALLELLSDMLDFSEIEAGRVELEAIDFAPVSVVEDVLDLFAQKAQVKKLALASLVDPGVCPLVRGDAARLRQILVNLVDNAVKFTDLGEVVVQVAPGSVPRSLSFEIRDTGPGISTENAARLFQPFTQADSSTTRRYGGTGLGLAISRRLVEIMSGTIGLSASSAHGSTFRFEVRLASSESDPVPGPRFDGRTFIVCEPHDATRAGLVQEIERLGARCHAFGAPAEVRAALDAGLVIHDGVILAREFAESLAKSGHVDLSRSACISDWTARIEKPQDATCGRLSRPLRRKQLHAALEMLARGADIARPRSLTEVRTGHSFERHAAARLLLVEDNAVNQKVAQKMLERLGLTCVEIALNGVEAVAAVNRGTFDLVLMDCQMPEMDGFEATRCIRALGGTKARVPIVAMTANAMRGDRERCLDSGMDDYMAKPIRVDLLRATIETWLVRAESATTPQSG